MEMGPAGILRHLSEHSRDLLPSTPNKIQSGHMSPIYEIVLKFLFTFPDCAAGEYFCKTFEILLQLATTTWLVYLN